MDAEKQNYQQGKSMNSQRPPPARPHFLKVLWCIRWETQSQEEEEDELSTKALAGCRLRWLTLAKGIWILRDRLKKPEGWDEDSEAGWDAGEGWEDGWRANSGGGDRSQSSLNQIMNVYWSQSGWGLPRRIQPRKDLGNRDHRMEEEEACWRAQREDGWQNTVAERDGPRGGLSKALENYMDMISSRLIVLGI